LPRPGKVALLFIGINLVNVVVLTVQVLEGCDVDAAYVTMVLRDSRWVARYLQAAGD